MKKILLMLFTFMIVCTGVYGGSVSLSSNKTSVYVGESVSFTIGVSNSTGKINISSSNPAVMSVSTSNAWIENNSVNFTATAKTVGTAVITIKSDATYGVSDSTTGDDFSVTKSITVTVKEKAVVTTPSEPTTTTPTAPVTETKSSNYFLKTLRLNVEGLTPAFSKYIDSYAVTVPSNVDNITVTPNPEDSKSKVTITGNTNLKIGNNKIVVRVTTEKGTYWDYEILVTKTDDVVKSNAFLTNLVIEDFDIDFIKEELEYDLGNYENKSNKLNILTFKDNENQNVEIIDNELKEGENVVKIKVTAEDNVTIKEYLLKVNYTGIVENEIYEEDDDEKEVDIYAYKDVEDKGININRKDLLLVILLIISLLELVQIIYLYRKYVKVDEVKEESRRRNI